MSTLSVKLDNLKPGIRYSFFTKLYPDKRVEGTFFLFVSPSPTNNEGNPQYIFKNCVFYDKNGRKEFIGMNNFGKPIDYPQDISIFTSKQLPKDLNQYINTFGGKSRKPRKSKRHRRKSTRRQNRK